MQAIGCSRGGRTSKIHALADSRGKPIALALTPGNVADTSVAATPLHDIATPRRLLADKAYDADHLRKPIEALVTMVVVHPSAHGVTLTRSTGSPTAIATPSSACSAK